MSNIGSSIKKRKRISFYKKASYSFIFFLFFISLFILLLTWQKIRIQNVAITGNSAVDKVEIEKLADRVLDEKYVWFIPTDNFFLFQNSELKKSIAENNKKIDSIHISYSDFPSSIEIYISDRAPQYLWCKNIDNCYFMDKDGFMYEKAPILKPNPYIEFSGLIDSEMIGKLYLPEKFSDISHFLEQLKNFKLQPISFVANDSHEYQIILSEGGKILLNDKNSFDSYTKNIQTLIDNGFVKIDTDFLKKLDYIDLRFGNKVPIKMRN